MERASSRALRSAVLAVGLALGGMDTSTAAQAPSSTIYETATVALIEVPVVVLHRGSPVRGLSVEDFVLLQDGVEQVIEGFEQVDLSLETMADGTPAAQPASLAGRRYFLLAFDLAHTQPANARRAVAAARDLVERGLHPTDLVGVSIYSAVAGARLLHPFTSDPSQLRAALLAVEAVTSRDPEMVEQTRAALDAEGGVATENLRRFLEEIRVFATRQGVGLESTMGPAGEWLAQTETSTEAGALMAEILMEMEVDYQKGIANVVRDRSFDLLETLAELASALEEVRGQKYFVLFSEGIDERTFENPFDTRGTQRLAAVMKSFQRSGWVVHAIDVGREVTDFRGMYLLTQETGGREYRNFNALDEAMGQMLERTSFSYVLSFQPPDLDFDGSYHRIEVRLRDRRGRQVRHRDGFFAPEAPGDAHDDFLVAQADRVAGYREGGPLQLAAMAAPFKFSETTSQVHAVLEIDGPTLLTGRQGDLLELQIDAYRLDESAGALPLSSRRLAIDVPTHQELVRSGGIKVLDDFLLGPGEHRLRLVVVEGARRSVVTLPVIVPDFAPGEPQLLQPFFPELSARWLVVSEGDEDPDAAGRSPFRFGERRFLPRVEVELDSDVAVPVCITGFDLPVDDPKLELELRAVDGGRPKAGSVRFASHPERSADGAFRVMVQLETAGMEAGHYEVQVTFVDGATGSSKVGSQAFEIRPSGG